MSCLFPLRLLSQLTFDFDFFCTLAGHDCSSLGIESRLWVRVIKDGNMVDLTLVLGDRRQFV